MIGSQTAVVGTPPWDDPGWLNTALSRVDQELSPAGLTRTGAPELMRHWMVSAILRIPTDCGPVWFKQVPELFAHEGRIMRWVSERSPEVAPKVIGTGPGWLLSAEMPAAAEQPRGHVLATLARLQRKSIGSIGELLRLGCPDRGLDRLVADIESLANRADLLQAETLDDLRSALPELVAIVRRTERLGIPATLVHGDIQDDNARWTTGGWVIIDWTDACVGHPFVDLARPLMKAGPQEQATARSAVADVWAELIPEPELAAALDAAPVLGAAHQAGTYQRIVDGIGQHDGFLGILGDWTHRLIAEVQQQILAGVK